MSRHFFDAESEADFNRPHRVKLLGEAAQALLRGELPAVEARLFLGGALASWLERGGKLEKDYLRVVKPKSHVTPAVVWKQIQSHIYDGQGVMRLDTIAPSSSKSEQKK
jgi:hypothetical protein